MKLNDLIAWLEKQPHGGTVPFGFGIGSVRKSYLVFKLQRNVTFASMLISAKAMVAKQMGNTECFISEDANPVEERIDSTLLRLWSLSADGIEIKANHYTFVRDLESLLNGDAVAVKIIEASK